MMETILDSIWVHLINKSVKVDKKTSGKWLIFDKLKNLNFISDSLKPYVEEGKIEHIKFSHRGLSDPFKDKTPVMCVYSDDKNKEKIWKILEKIGVNKKIWKYDSQTNEDWKKGGRLYKERLRLLKTKK